MPRIKKPVEEAKIEEAQPEVAAEGIEAEKPTVSKLVRVSIYSKGRFTLFGVGKEFVVENQSGQVIGRPASHEEGEKLVQDLNR